MLHIMEISETIYAPDRTLWRAWLEEHCNDRSEIWLIFYKKAAGKPNIAYNDAVEEALCFGWIDSIRKKLDDDRLAHRFTPRRPKSGYSQPNIERLSRMLEQGKVSKTLESQVREIVTTPFVFPQDILDALQSNVAAWENFQRFSRPYQRIRVAFVDQGRKREGEFEKRLANLIKKSAQGKQFGYGINTYY